MICDFQFNGNFKKMFKIFSFGVIFTALLNIFSSDFP